ncbi:MAG: hypothetical protein AAF495_26495 [Pseudomonadota bacterium]
MDLSLQVVAVDLADEDLQRLTQELCSTINQETDLDARQAVGESVPGTRGEAIEIGHLILTFLTSGTAVALVHVLKAYVSRNASFKGVLRRSDGASFEISADNLSGGQVDRTMDQLERFMGQGA